MNRTQVFKVARMNQEMPTRTSVSGTSVDAGPIDWAPDSWQQREALQQPYYEDAIELAAAGAHLSRLPPLVTSWEVLALKQSLAEAQEGHRFMLQGGDCAESFADCTSPVISNRLKVLLQIRIASEHG